MQISNATTHADARHSSSDEEERRFLPGTFAGRERYGVIDRERALARLERFVFDCFAREDMLALEEFWGNDLERADDVPDALREVSAAALDAWTFFDRPIADGRLLVDILIAFDSAIRPGELAFLRAMRESTMRLWAIEEICGGFLVLRDVIEQRQLVAAGPAPREPFQRGQWLAARVLPCGVSGGPELERDVLLIPEWMYAAVRTELSHMLRDSQGSSSPSRRDGVYKTLPPYFHRLWLESTPCAFTPDEEKTSPNLQVRNERTPPAEQQVSEHLVRYYRAWLDEPLPLFHGKTPRQAAQSPDLRGRVLELLHALCSQYEHALIIGGAAYDPSWLWAELGAPPLPAGARSRLSGAE